MKQIISILILTLFCVNSFNFKAHYCFKAYDGTRFYGTCKDFDHDNENYQTGNLIRADQHTRYKLVKDLANQKPATLKFEIAANYFFLLDNEPLIKESYLQEYPPMSESFQNDGGPTETNLLRGPPNLNSLYC